MEDKILEKLKFKIAISEIKKESEIAMKKKFINKKIGIAACACLILTTGVVFAKDIEQFVKYYFGLNETVNKAAENGYVEEINSNIVDNEVILEEQEKGIVIDDIDVSLKFDEFVMDDLNLSVNMTYEFDEKIKEVFDFDRLQHITIRDLIIIDEENRIILCNASLPEFNELRKKYNIKQEYGDYGDDFYNIASGYEILGKDKEKNVVKYNMTGYASDIFFPKSKELRFIFSKIKLEGFEAYIGQDIKNGEYLDSNSITLTGDWEFKVKVPEKMYNRKNVEYEVISVSNPDVEIYLSEASETGFCLGAIVSNVIETTTFAGYEYLEGITKQKDNGEISEEEWQKMSSEYVQTEEFHEGLEQFKNDREIIKRTNWIKDENGVMTNKKVSYVENEKGQKFYTALLMKKNEFIEGNKFDFFDVYEMTKNDLTDKLTVNLYMEEEVVKVELKKIK